MLVSSSGMAIDMHYCMGRLQDVSVFGKAKSCMPLEFQNKCNTTTRGIQKSTQYTFKKAVRSCCHDTKINIDNSDDEFSTTQEITIPQHHVSVLVSLVYVFFLPTYQSHSIPFYTYRPPPLCLDITILTQHFLC